VTTPLVTEEVSAPHLGSAVASIKFLPDLVGRAFTVFGTFGSMLVTQQSALRQADQVLAAELRAIDLTCSRFRPDSELVAVNKACGERISVSPLLAEAIEVALRAAAATDGDVDPTCGRSLVHLGYDRDFASIVGGLSEPELQAAPAGGWQNVELDSHASTVRVPVGVLLDLGATAKALAADRAAAAIAAATGAGVLVNLGGDIAVAGPPPVGGWRIQIVDDLPGRSAQRMGPSVAIEDGGLATSSTASRSWLRGHSTMHHIVEPGTGLSVKSCWTSVTVAAASCVDANTASTAAIIRSRNAVDWLEGLGMPARLVRPDGRVSTTGGWPDES